MARSKAPRRPPRSGRSTRQKPPFPTEHRISSWPEFVATVSAPGFEGWTFRGQQRADWPLAPSLARHLRDFVPDLGTWRQQESRSIRIFRRKAHHFIAGPDDLDDTFHCVAHMQHHGAPTRLLDFTKSPFVAAFFALEKATGDAAVWAVNTFALFEGIRLRGKLARYGRRHLVDPRIAGNFERYFLENSVPFVWSGEPFRMNRRLTAQSGTFVVPGVLDLPVEDILATYPHPERLLVKLVLPAPELRNAAMAALYRMNLTQATLFPDLDGLARSLAYELETSWRGASQRPSFYTL
jgi:hypothetical protein